MLMRYHWGLGVGHIYCHGRTEAPSTSTDTQTINTAADEDSVNEEPPDDDNASDAENPELGFDDNHEDDWTDIEEGSENEPEEEDEIIVTMDDMYGSI